MSLGANTLYYGDCLEWLPQFPSESVDLIYLDPPFNSNQDYNLLFGTGNRKRGNGRKSAQVRAFDDTWRWDDSAAKRTDRLVRAAAHPAHKAVVGLRTMLGECGMLAYLSYMAERLAEMPRVLKHTGSIYLHCDPTASHGLKLVMDCVFGPARFRNEITWQRATAHNDAKRYGNNTDRILYYTRDQRARTWNGRDIAVPKTGEEIAKSYPSRDARGAFRSADLTAAGIRYGESGLAWREYDISPRNVHWRPPLTGQYALWIENNIIPGYRSIKGVHDRLDALDEAEMIRHPQRGFWPGLKRYANADTGKAVQALWTDIPGFTNYRKGPDFLGYPTQKPVALLERIIKASSNAGDLILDPFCGCGTAVAAAHKLNRKWAGIDISPFAIDLIAQKRFPEFKVPTEGYPYDLAGAQKLASEQPFKFERWAVTRIPGLAPNDKQVGDGGIDGVGYLLAKPEDTTDQVLAQVKGGKYQLGQLRDFLGVMERERAAMGLCIPPLNRSERQAHGQRRPIRGSSLWVHLSIRVPNCGRSKPTSTTRCRNFRRSRTRTPASRCRPH